MITNGDVGGVHIKYLHHCRRQLWLYARGLRPEALSTTVQLGEAVHATSYRRASPIDLGSARLDDLDGELWVHEIKSSSRPSSADEAQAIHYCYRLRKVGVQAQGAVLHYPKTRRTRRLPYAEEWDQRAQDDIAAVLDTVAAPTAPERLRRSACRGCSYYDYCWSL
ncbi:CRISPR-associated exonuclease Cas4 [Nocardiopsis mwathae]|uniref:CRISPR-associated exonuclease Cas4 n=1 Tax=Nocardiopsis mwathae TaxID=1472723 RepID=A0A7X0D8N4_9ACTN|nr:CRISPR-associated exonuclease Cas4 [Nocardiopsis mwathae]